MSDPTSQSTPDLVHDLVPDLAKELGLPPAGVRAVVDLLAEGNTVPFIARYRKGWSSTRPAPPRPGWPKSGAIRHAEARIPQRR